MINFWYREPSPTKLKINSQAVQKILISIKRSATTHPIHVAHSPACWDLIRIRSAEGDQKSEGLTDRLNNYCIL